MCTLLATAVAWSASNANNDSTEDGEKCPPTSEQPANPPNPEDYVDPENIPESWEWRGKGLPDSREGAWHNPNSGESLHDDRTHPKGKPPHWTYPDKGGTRWDNFGNGWSKQ